MQALGLTVILISEGHAVVIPIVLTLNHGAVINRPFYSSGLSNLASECQRGWS